MSILKVESLEFHARGHLSKAKLTQEPRNKNVVQGSLPRSFFFSQSFCCHGDFDTLSSGLRKMLRMRQSARAWGERMGVREQEKKVRWGKAVEDWWLTDRVTGRALVFGELLVLSDQPRVPTCRQVSVRIVKPRQTCWQIFANRLQGFVWRWPIHPVTSNSLWVSSHRSSPCLLSVFPSHPNIRVDRKRLSYFFSEVNHFYGDISNVD